MVCAFTLTKMTYWAFTLQNIDKCLKIFRVLHIFSKDGTYVYITNEINQYNRLITLMQYYYPSHFKICKSLIKGVQNIDINLLENHIRAPHPPK